MAELFQYNFFVNAFAAALLASISCGFVGVYIVSRRLVFVSGGISHASFGGLGIGMYLGINPLWGAGAFAVATALGIESLAEKIEVREDSLIGMMWSLGMAVGIIFVYITPGYAANLMSYLFGNILTVSRAELAVMGSLTVFVVFVFVLLMDRIVFVSFDPEYARTQKSPVFAIRCLLISLVALTVVVNIRVVGIILVISMMTVPQATANLLVKDFRRMIVYSVIFGMAASLGGLIISYYLDIPSGATIIFSSLLIFALVSGIKRLIVHLRLKSAVESS